MTGASLFAFYGRVSTEDQQDPEASRNWQLSRARALIESKGGRIATEFFDLGESRSIPWKRRVHAALLLNALKDPQRGFGAVVIGEPQRAFYGNQYGLTMPVFAHYGVQLWVPEVGGAIDPDSEAHELIMSVFGGMSKGERNRIKIRVRAAMAAQAEIEGRFLGGRPPYGYRLVDAGPHPHPAKAADGKRLHRLEPDPLTSPIVQRIFAEYLLGLGDEAIAEGLNRDRIPCPSAYDRARNPHRAGLAWAGSAVRAILLNPRYTGRQVWNKQRKDEVLIDVEDVALGHETRMRWNDEDTWIWSAEIVHEPVVEVEDFERAQAIRAKRRDPKARVERAGRTSKYDYQLRGVLSHHACGRKMEGNWNNGKAHYRCRYREQYAKASGIDHPRNVYVREDLIVPALDDWLAGAFSPHRMVETCRRLADATDNTEHDGITAQIRRELADCDRRLANYRALVDNGTDPATVAGWIRDVEIERAALQARIRQTTGRERMSPAEIEVLVTGLGDLVAVIRDADPADKAEIYQRLGLHLTYDDETQKVLAEIVSTSTHGAKGRVRGGT